MSDPGKLGKQLAPLIGMVFAVPAAAGFGDHWPIDKSEADAIAKQLEECIKQLPKGAAKNIMLILGQYAPWVGLAMTTYAITAPRVRETIRIRHVQRLSATESPIVRAGLGVTPAGNNGSVGGTGVDERPTGRTRPDVARRFEDGQ